MTTETENNIKINKFFNGEMPEEERFEFEKEFAAKPELLEEMRTFEADLIEKYVRGWMNPAEKLKFEKNFLNTEKRRQKVEFSRLLIEEIRQENVSPITETESFWSKFGSLFLTPKIAMATAFSVLLLIFGGWFLTRSFENDKTEIVKNRNTANTEISNLETKVNVETNQVNANQNTNSNLENTSVNAPVKSPTPTIQNSPEPNKTPIRETPKIAPNPVLGLFAGTLRDGGEIKELNLPKNSGGAIFQLNLKIINYKIFRADVTDGNGKVVFRSGNLTPRKAVLNLFVPAKNLQKGDYRINLYGKNSAGENESAADFQFRVN